MTHLSRHQLYPSDADLLRRVNIENGRLQTLANRLESRAATVGTIDPADAARSGQPRTDHVRWHGSAPPELAEQTEGKDPA